MKYSWLAVATLLMSVAMVGCGGSDTPGVSADKDEVAQWVEQNPLPEVDENAPDLDLSSE